MRWVFISLLLMNLAYLGYELSKGEAPVQSQQAVTLNSPKSATQLVLLSEMAEPANKKAPVNASQAAQTCWAVGSFATELDAKHVYARMLALDIQAQVQGREKLLKKEFWVYLPPLASQKQALRKLKELQHRKIDSYIITEGELQNGISLGLFSQQDSVDRLVANLKKKQIDPEIKVLDRTRTEYWVLAPTDAGVDMTEDMQGKLTGDQDGLEWQQIRCP